MKIILYKLFLYLTYFGKRYISEKSRGLGWVAEKIGKKFCFQFKNSEFVFLPAAARSYGFLPIGYSNEPETHRFLDIILSSCVSNKIVFVDVGASVGEFVIPISKSPSVRMVIGFEPHPSTYAALCASVSLNSSGTNRLIDLRNVAIGSTTGQTAFQLNERAPMAAHISTSNGDQKVITVPLSTLDSEAVFKRGDYGILLIDIEGGELAAISGAQKTLKDHSPLIIFEYNSTTKIYFSLDEISKALGDIYVLFRLNSNTGILDLDLENTWNIVAIPKVGIWSYLLNYDDLFDN